MGIAIFIMINFTMGPIGIAIKLASTKKCLFFYADGSRFLDNISVAILAKILPTIIIGFSPFLFNSSSTIIFIAGRPCCFIILVIIFTITLLGIADI